MKIVLDARGIRAGMTGVGHYTQLLAEALCEARPQDSFVFLGLEGQDPALRSAGISKAANAQWVEVGVDPENHPKADFWMVRNLPGLLDELGADVFHGPAFQVPFGRFQSRAARILTVHDWSVFTMPKAYPWKFRFYLRHAISRSVAAAHRVICLTDFGRHQARELFPKEPAEKFISVHSAPDGVFQPLEKGSLALPSGDFLREHPDFPKRYILMVGTLETRKNPEFFLKLYKEMERLEFRDGSGGALSPPILVWAGGAGRGAEAFLRKFEGLREKGLFYWLNGAQWGDLPFLYQSALALAYPSHHEGFGLPLLEAMACATPVLAADTTCLPEVVGDGGRILSLDRPDLWAEALAGFCSDPGLRFLASQRALKRAGSFSWGQTARESARVYEKALGI